MQLVRGIRTLFLHLCWNFPKPKVNKEPKVKNHYSPNTHTLQHLRFYSDNFKPWHGVLFTSKLFLMSPPKLTVLSGLGLYPCSPLCWLLLLLTSGCNCLVTWGVEWYVHVLVIVFIVDCAESPLPCGLLSGWDAQDSQAGPSRVQGTDSRASVVAHTVSVVLTPRP